MGTGWIFRKPKQWGNLLSPASSPPLCSRTTRRSRAFQNVVLLHALIHIICILRAVRQCSLHQAANSYGAGCSNPPWAGNGSMLGLGITVHKDQVRRPLSNIHYGVGWVLGEGASGCRASVLRMASASCFSSGVLLPLSYTRLHLGAGTMRGPYPSQLPPAWPTALLQQSGDEELGPSLSPSPEKAWCVRSPEKCRGKQRPFPVWRVGAIRAGTGPS